MCTDNYYVITRTLDESKCLYQQTRDIFSDIISKIPVVDESKKLIVDGSPYVITINRGGVILRLYFGLDHEIGIYKINNGDKSGEWRTYSSLKFNPREFAMNQIREILRKDKEDDVINITVLVLDKDYDYATEYLHRMTDTIRDYHIRYQYMSGYSKASLTVGSYATIQILKGDEIKGFLSTVSANMILTLPTFLSLSTRIVDDIVLITKKYRLLEG